MTYLDRQFAENFRGAAHEELISGEALFMADMAEVLTPEAIAEGVSISFGANRERFIQVLETLSVDSLIKRGQLEAVKGVIGRGYGSYSHVAYDRIQDTIHDHGVLNTLEFMQSEAWVLDKRLSLYPRLSVEAESAIVSHITLGKIAQTQEARRVIAGEPLISIDSAVKYVPEAWLEYGEGAELPYVINHHEKKEGRTDQRRFQYLLDWQADNGVELQLPGQTFTMVISSNISERGEMYGVAVEPIITHQYVVKNDRIVPFVRPEDDLY